MPKNIETEIAVVGCGGSGLSAAVAAAEKGAKVIVLESRNTAGGNTLSAVGMFAAESHVQKKAKIDARKDELFRVAMAHSHWKLNPRIIGAFIDRSGGTIRWLEEKGLRFQEIHHYYPNQVPSVFHVPEGRGPALVKALVGRGEELGVRFFFETAAKRILSGDKGEITGVLAETKRSRFRITAKSVIIATGGYGGNKKLLKEHYPSYTSDLHLVGLPHRGDGVLMAQRTGAASEGLGILMLGGPRFMGPRSIDTAALEPHTIWVNKKGERFVDEATAFRWPEASNALNRQPERISVTLFDEKIKKSLIEDGVVKGNSTFGPGSTLTELERDLRSAVRKGEVTISDTWDVIAGWIGADRKVLKSTIDQYNACCDRARDDTFAKDSRYLMPLRTPPYYAVRCHLVFLTTIGGIKINHHMEVLNHHDTPIPGLYAVGNDVGGWQSDTYCIHLSGNAFGFAINSGRIAGESAARYALDRSPIDEKGSARDSVKKRG
jgi:fumarate reductase flavoprotein subunit